MAGAFFDGVCPGAPSNGDLYFFIFIEASYTSNFCRTWVDFGSRWVRDFGFAWVLGFVGNDPFTVVIVPKVTGAVARLAPSWVLNVPRARLAAFAEGPPAKGRTPLTAAVAYLTSGERVT